MPHLTEFPESQHPADERLVAFAAGDLVESELEQISRHVASCDDCCARLASIHHCDPLESRLAEVLSEPQQEAGGRVPASVLRWLVSSCQSDDARELAQSAVPQQILQYRIVREVARGGMGVVYEAVDVNLHRRVAIKMILAGEFSSSEMRIRFRREAELQARIHHPGMIQVFEIGEYRGLPFLAMEWIDGGTLADQIKLRTFESQDAAELIRQLAEAVHAAHLQGVIHRDLKPSNILLSTRGPLLSDFGIAFRPDDDVRLTVSGVLSGTPEYTAPELGTERSRRASAATDIYALGVILYEMISGQCPFRGVTGLETLRKSSSDSLIPLRRHRADVPSDLDVIVSKCLEKQPASRYSSAAALAEDLAAYLEGRPITARQTSLGERAWRWCRRSPIIASLLLALVVAIVAGSTLSIWLAAIASKNAAEADQLSRQSLAIASVARESQLRAERAEHLARERASDAMSVLLETAWNDGDAGKFFRYVRNITDGQDVAGLPFEQKVLLRRLESGHTKFEHHLGMLTTSCQTRDGKRLYVGTNGYGVLEFSVESESFTQTRERHPHQLTCLLMSLNEDRIFAGDADGNLLSWERTTGKRTACEKIHNGIVDSVESLSDGRLVTAGIDGVVQIVSPELQVEQVLRKNVVFPVAAVSRDGQFIAIGSRMGDIEILDAVTMESVGKCFSSLCNVRSLEFSHSGQLLAIAGVDGVVSLLEVGTMPRIVVSKQVGNGELVSIQWSPDDSVLAVGGVDQRVLLLSSDALQTEKTFLGHQGTVSAVEFVGPHQSEIASVGHDGTIRIWSETRNPNPERFRWGRSRVSQVDQQILELSEGGDRSFLHRLESICNEDINCLAMSLDATMVAVGAADGGIHIINLATMTRVGCLPTTHGVILSLQFLNEQHDLASCGDDGLVRIWKSATADGMKELRGHTGAVRTLVVDTKQQRLISGGDDSRIILWSLADHKATGELTGHRDKVFDLVISNKGDLYSASEDGTVRAWDQLRLEERQQFDGHVGPVRCVTVSPDGTRAASGGWDQSVIIWNCETGQQVARWEDHTGEISELCFSRDGQTLTSLGYNGEAVRWKSSRR